MSSDYQSIESHGVIGNLRTAALVDLRGRIDWLCAPDFDSPSVFASILDSERGGHFSVTPVEDDVISKQYYLPETNVLVTRFVSNDGVAELVDFMPVYDPARGRTRTAVVRRVTGIRGSLKLRMECAPEFDYARQKPEAQVTRKFDPISSSVRESIVFTSDAQAIGIVSDIPTSINDGRATAEFECREGERQIFVMGDLNPPTDSVESLFYLIDDSLMKETIDYWRNWLSQSSYTGRWREMVHRSALTLKLLTHAPTGAIVAAPTTSLPEFIGGERNWDYRYSWIRDASFTIYAFLRLGFNEEASRFMQWIQKRCEEANSPGDLSLMYTLSGGRVDTEFELDHLDGYRDSKPVRVGNDATHQLQLDIYGELMDSVYIYNRDVSPISYDFWVHLAEMVDWVCDNWREMDDGIWEVRSGRQHFVYSKVMCWVAVNRAIRLGTDRGFPMNRESWEETQNEIYQEIMREGWNPEIGSFVQSYGSSTLDASILAMPFLFFISPTDPRMLSTLDAAMRPPHAGGLLSNSLVYRYNLEHTDDGLDGEEGAFSMCTFWLVESLTRAGRFEPARLDKARLIFERMLGYANHLGLYAEEVGPVGEALGNFPQAFTHVSLISAAFDLDRALGSGV